MLKTCINCGEENLDNARFCDSCGKALAKPPARPPTINVKAPPGMLLAVSSGRGFELEPDREMLIGRGDSSKGLEPDILLDDEAALPDGVSRLHAKVFCEGNKYYIVDLNSTNSTYLNKMKLVPQERYELSDGDEIQLGRYLLRLRFVQA